MALTNPAFTTPEFSPRGNVAGAQRTAVPTPPAGYQESMSAQQLGDLYDRPAASPVETDRMSYEDTIVKTFVTFGVLVAGAVVGWFLPGLALVGALVGFVFAMINTFKRKPSPALVILYAVFQGLFVGGISNVFSAIQDGIVPIAVFGTLGVVGATLLLFLNGKLRTSPKATKIFLVAMVGYAVFSLVNLGLTLFGVVDGFGLRENPLINIGLMLLVVALAAYSLVMDFEAVQHGVRNGAPRVYAWRAAFGIVVTVVWLYLEILRFLAIFSSND